MVIRCKVPMSKRTVSLVLGSGGARGLAHIGVIEWLGANGFDIQSIAGSSMGALIGGVYAMGKLDVYTHWVLALERMDIVRLLDFSFGRNALFKGERLVSVLRELIGDRNIEDLPISFTAVATDLDEGKEVWLNRGSLFDAIRASIAIPTIFTPYNLLGKHLVDGGLVNPIPIAPTLNDKTDITIAVNLSAKADSEMGTAGETRANPRDDAIRYYARIAQFIEGLQRRQGAREIGNMGLFDMVGKSIDIMENTIARFKLASYSPDILIDIPKNACAFYEFHRAGELIALGRQRAKDAVTSYSE